MTDTAPACRRHSSRVPAALRVAVALVAVVTVIVVGLAGLFAPPASAQTLTQPGNAVGASKVAGGQVVGVHPDIPAGQRRARAPSYDPSAVGSCVAAESELAGVGPATGIGPGAASINDPALGGEVTRVGRWMSPSEFDTMSSTGRVVEGGGGRTFVVNPPNPAAYLSAPSGSVYAEFDVPSSSLRAASKPEWSVIPGPNVTTGIFGAPPEEMPPATCIEWVCGK